MSQINDLTERIAPPSDDWRSEWHSQGLVWALVGEKHPELPGKVGDYEEIGSDRYFAIEGMNLGHRIVDRIGKEAANRLGQSLMVGMAIVLVGAGLFHALTFWAVI